MPNPQLGVAGYPVGIDAYTAAFMVPDFLFFILVSGALSVTFIPVFNQRLAKGNKQSAWELSTSMVNLLAIITMVASILMMIFAEPLMRYVVAPGLTESGMALATSMMRVIAINPFLFAITTVIISMQQAVGRFTFSAMAPAIYNIGIIIGVTVFTNGINIFGWEIFEGGIMGVALGVVLGAVLQLIVSSIGLLGLGFDYRFKIFWRNKGFKKVLSLLPARSLDQGMDYIVSIVETNLASRMASGTIRAYQQALTLHMMPINLIGVSISNAAYPRLTEDVASGREDLFRKNMQKIIRVIAWMILPIATITFFARGYVVHFIMNGGNVLMAGALGGLVVAMVFRSLYHIIARSFYAHQDTKTPFYVSIFAISVNISLAIWFFKLDFGAYGLAFAQSIVALIEVAILMVIMNRRIIGIFDREFWQAMLRMVIATSLMGLVTYIGVVLLPLRSTDLSFWSVFPKFAVITLLSFGAYLLVCYLMKIKEVEPVLKRLNKILFSRLTFKN